MTGSTTAAAEPPDDAPIFVEPRWPIALVLAAYIAMTISLRIAVPDRPRIGPEWLVPSVEILFLVVLVLADPAHISARARWLRRVALALTFGLLALSVTSWSRARSTCFA